MVRAVDVRTSKGVLTRSVQRLHLLELTCDDLGHASDANLGMQGEQQEEPLPADIPDSVSVEGDSFVSGSQGETPLAETFEGASDERVSAALESRGEHARTRRGRIVKPPVRLDL